MGSGMRQPIYAAAQSAPQQAPSTGGYTDEEFSRHWLLGLMQERSLGRPKEWNGREDGFDTFAFRFSNWLGGMPGNAEELLEASAQHTTAVSASELGFASPSWRRSSCRH